MLDIEAKISDIHKNLKYFKDFRDLKYFHILTYSTNICIDNFFHTTRVPG